MNSEESDNKIKRFDPANVSTQPNLHFVWNYNLHWNFNWWFEIILHSMKIFRCLKPLHKWTVSIFFLSIDLFLCIGYTRQILLEMPLQNTHTHNLPKLLSFISQKLCRRSNWTMDLSSVYWFSWNQKNNCFTRVFLCNNSLQNEIGTFQLNFSHFRCFSIYSFRLPNKQLLVAMTDNILKNPKVSKWTLSLSSETL